MKDKIMKYEYKVRYYNYLVALQNILNIEAEKEWEIVSVHTDTAGNYNIIYLK